MADAHRLTVEVTTDRGRLAALEVVETLLAGKTQVDDDIHPGDVLVIESEKVVGVLHSAWPAAVTRTRGELHGFGHPSERPQGADGPSTEMKVAIREALDVARRYGWETDPNAEAQAV